MANNVYTDRTQIGEYSLSVQTSDAHLTCSVALFHQGVWCKPHTHFPACLEPFAHLWTGVDGSVAKHVQKNDLTAIMAALKEDL